MNSLHKIALDWTGCLDCSLSKHRNEQVWFRTEGNSEQGTMMLIGEAPGADEDLEGIPFVGKAGAKLNRLLAEAEICDIVIINMIACRPPGNRNPGRKELRACWPRVQRMIEAVRPRIIISAGNIASRWLLDTDKSMQSMSKKVFMWTLGNKLSACVFPVYHPSYLLRCSNASKDLYTINRLKLAREYNERKRNTW